MNCLPCLILSVTIIFSGLCQVLGDDDSVRMQTECFKEVGIAGGQSPDPPEIQRQKFSFCFAKKLGIMNASGDILSDDLKAFLKKRVADGDRVNTIAAKCALQGESAGETAEQLFACLQKEGVRMQ